MWLTAKPVEGLYTGKVFPLADLCHSLLMKICMAPTHHSITKANDIKTRKSQ